jgi:hypothetical protein
MPSPEHVRANEKFFRIVLSEGLIGRGERKRHF